MSRLQHVSDRLGRKAKTVLGHNKSKIEALTIPVGQISMEESRCLIELIQNFTEPGPIIEIGTLFGWSTRIMTCAKAPERELISVDKYVWNPLGLTPDEHYEATRMVLTESMAKYNVKQVRMDKDEFYRTYDGPSPVLVFLDADHDYGPTKADILWAQKVGSRVIAAHDYCPEWPGVVQAVNECGGPKKVIDRLAIV
jgi:predicted O-methyltransferase YrrM